MQAPVNGQEWAGRCDHRKNSKYMNKKKSFFSTLIQLNNFSKPANGEGAGNQKHLSPEEI